MKIIRYQNLEEASNNFALHLALDRDQLVGFLLINIYQHTKSISHTWLKQHKSK